MLFRVAVHRDLTIICMAKVFIVYFRFIFPELKIILAATRENQSSGFPTRSDTNRPLQSQKQARSLKFGFKKKKRKCSIRVAKTKALISFAVTAKLICAFVFA